MAKKKATAADGCPVCGGDLKAARVPTDAEFAKAFDREDPTGLREGTDTAAPDVRAELGALHTCRDCGYKTRIVADAAASGTPAS